MSPRSTQQEIHYKQNMLALFSDYLVKNKIALVIFNQIACWLIFWLQISLTSTNKCTTVLTKTRDNFIAITKICITYLNSHDNQMGITNLLYSFFSLNLHSSYSSCPNSRFHLASFIFSLNSVMTSEEGQDLAIDLNSTAIAASS